MANAIIDTFDIWTTAQNLKTSNRGLSASNQSLLGIKKLRELILELAVRGKLLPQNPEDEPAFILLEKIEKEKKRLIKEGVIKKPEALPEVGEVDKPFKLPIGWEWVKIRNVGHDWGQKTPDSDFTYIEVSAIDNTKGEITSPTILEANEAPSRARKIVKPGTVIYSTVRPYLKNICVIAKEYTPEPIASTAFAILHPYFQMPGRYFQFYFQSPVFVSYVESVQNGIAYPAINDKQFFSGVIPLPPLAEQHRIIAKVDELMVLCDQLEQQQTSSNEAHQTLVDTLLGTLTNAKSPKDFDEAWQRIANHFDTLLTTEHSIDQLKQTILQLAVMGKLVPQNPDDEPASELLKKIAKEKARLVKEGKIKKQEQLTEIKDDENPFKLPAKWIWAKLGNLSANVHYGYTASADQLINDVRLLRITDIQDNLVNWETVPGCNIDKKNIADYQLGNGDILIARTGGTIGKSYLVSNINLCAVFASYLIRIRHIDQMYPNFIKAFLGSQLYWNQLEANSMGTGQPNVNGNALKNLLFPLPPLAEQHRIVAKVDELFALCDALKERIRDAQALQNQLAVAVVEKILNKNKYK
jgi:type I restriction enzyme S subunit